MFVNILKNTKTLDNAITFSNVLSMMEMLNLNKARSEQFKAFSKLLKVLSF